MGLIFSLVKLSLASRVWAASMASRRLRLRLQMQTAAAAAPARRRPRLAEAITVVRSRPSSAERLEPEQTPAPDPEQMMKLVKYVRSVAHYLDNLSAVDIIVKNNIDWPKVE